MTYDEHWDRPHTPGPEDLWQESDCYWFYDAGRGVGGFHRIGQQPNRGVGHVMLFVFEDGESRYRNVIEIPGARASRSETGQRVGGSTVKALGGGRMRYGWSEPETEADLEWVESFYTPRDWSRRTRAEDVKRVTNPDGHLECSGRIRGRLRLGEKEWTIDALAHRDRSWGMRDVTMAAQHRMVSGTLGPELSFATFVLHLRQGGMHAAGFVVRDGVETDIRDLRVLTTLDNDGFTATGATARLVLENGETLEIPCVPRQGFLSVTGGSYISTDTICSVTLNGRTGFCDLEVSNNPTRGTWAPTKESEVCLVAVETGLSKARRYDL